MSSLPSLVLLVRHGATEWSESGQYTGRTDLALTATGEAEARAVAPLLDELLEGAEPLVYASPLRRAHETARLAFPRVPATLDDDLAEYDYGDYEGLLTNEILARDPHFDLFGAGCPGGETPDAVAARCDRFSRRVHAEAPGRAVIAFTHGHLSRVLTARLLGLPVSTAAALFNETASVSLINVHRGRWVLVGWNVRASSRFR